MNPLLQLFLALLGPYTQQFITAMVSFAHFVLYALLFASDMPRRPRFALRLLLLPVYWIILSLLVSFFRVNWDYYAMRVFLRSLHSFAAIPVLLFLFQAPLVKLLRPWCASVAAGRFGTHFFQLIMAIAGRDSTSGVSLFAVPEPVRDYALFYAMIFGSVFILWLVFGRNRVPSTDETTDREILWLSLITVCSIGLLNSILRESANTVAAAYIVALLYSLILSVFILLLYKGILLQGAYRGEIRVVNELIREQKKQYESAKENMDLVNMKVHDLKHLLSSVEDKLTRDEITSLREAMEIYDSSIRTGNEILDVVLYEKQLLCQKEDIRLTCMADGSLLEFLPASHLYTLFHNAISNAVEAVRKLDNPEKRVISMILRKENDTAAINVTNFYRGTLTFQDGLPRTGKDEPNLHGYGMKSIRYIANLYGGTVHVNADGELFSLDIMLPLSSGQKDGDTV